CFRPPRLTPPPRQRQRHTADAGCAEQPGESESRLPDHDPSREATGPRRAHTPIPLLAAARFENVRTIDPRMLEHAIFENGVWIFAWEIYPVFNSPYSWNRAEAGTALRW